jgi:hypothetical protein
MAFSNLPANKKYYSKKPRCKLRLAVGSTGVMSATDALAKLSKAQRYPNFIIASGIISALALG